MNSYDHVGRIKEAKSSSEANGVTIDGAAQLQNLPYRQSYQFNAFGDMTERYNKFWGGDTYLTTSYDITNHRVSGWQYDADGRVVMSSEPGSNNSAVSYGANGQLIYKHDYTALTVSEDKLYRYLDGDGREVKRIAEKCQIYLPEQTECWWGGGDSIYYIRSSVLGGETISEVGSSGGKSVS